MRRLITLIAAITLAAVISSQARAAFTSVAKSTIPLTTTITGVGQVLMTAELRDINIVTGVLGGTTTQINWTGITLPKQWRVASAAIVLHSTITVPNGGIQIFTDNTAADASPRYVGISTSALGAMLDSADVPGVNDGETFANLVTEGEQRASRVGLCWRAVDSSTNSLTITQTDVDSNPNNGNDILFSEELGPIRDGLGNIVGGHWFFMLDKGHMSDILAPPSDQNGGDFVTVKDNRGVHFFPGPDDFASMVTPDIVYLGGNFANVFAGRTYKANLRMETFTE